MKSLKIVQTPVRYYPYVGGIEVYVRELATELCAQGDSVTVVCANEPKTESSFVDGKVQVIKVPYITKIANTNIMPALLVQLLKQDFDIIHTHIPTPWAADMSALAAFLKRKPLVVTYQNDIMKDGGVGSVISWVYNHTLLRLVLKSAKKIIITQPRYINYSKYLKPYQDKIIAIPLGVKPPGKIGKVSRESNQFFFLSLLDRHHRYKGLDVLLRALSQVKDQYPDIKLLVGGKGELIGEYQELSRSLGIGPMVEFLGFVEDSELPRLYASSAAFVLPSINSLEGFGIVALEALAYETPVITTTLTGSSTDITKHNAGIVIPSNDVNALADAIIAIVEDPASAREMGKRGGQLTKQNYSWQKIAQQIHKVYEDVMT